MVFGNKHKSEWLAKSKQVLGSVGVESLRKKTSAWDGSYCICSGTDEFSRKEAMMHADQTETLAYRTFGMV